MRTRSVLYLVEFCYFICMFFTYNLLSFTFFYRHFWLKIDNLIHHLSNLISINLVRKLLAREGTIKEILSYIIILTGCILKGKKILHFLSLFLYKDFRFSNIFYETETYISS